MESKTLISSIRENIGKVMVGSEETIDLLLTALIAEGHVLIEDVPGMGKTVLAHALAKTLGGHLSEVVDIATTLDLAADLRRRDELTEQLLGALAGMVKDLLDEPFTDTLLPSGRVRGTTDTYRDLALELADRVAILNQGRIEQQGSPEQLYAQPVSHFAAGFVGRMNLLPAVAESGDAVRVGEGRLECCTAGFEAGDALLVGVRPESVVLHPAHRRMLEQLPCGACP